MSMAVPDIIVSNWVQFLVQMQMHDKNVEIMLLIPKDTLIALSHQGICVKELQNFCLGAISIYFFGGSSTMELTIL